MATANKVKIQSATNELYQASVYHVKFFRLKDKAEAWCQIKYEAKMTRGNPEVITMELPVLSLWVDDASGNAAKAHLHAYGNDKGLRDFLKLCYREGSVDFSARRQEFTADRSGMIIRLGMRYDQYESRDEDGYSRIPIYDSKSLAVKAAIDCLISGNVSLGGTELINFNEVPDTYMEQLGFEKVPDVLGVGVPMWKGKPDSIIKKSSYRGFSYEKEKQNRAGFLDLLQRALAEKVS